MNVTDSNEISWSFDGDDWVPTSVKLNVIDTRRLESAVQSIYERTINEGNRFQVQPLTVLFDTYLDENSIDILSTEISATNSRLSVYSKSLENWDGEETTVSSNRAKAVCPDGQYVAGIHGIDTDTGKFCTSCISIIDFVCRPLPKP